jgi:Saposin-like type B, region 2
VSQAIGAGSMINEQCKNFVRQYVPQILHLIDTMPPEQVQSKLNTTVHDAYVNTTTPVYQTSDRLFT